MGNKFCSEDNNETLRELHLWYSTKISKRVGQQLPQELQKKLEDETDPQIRLALYAMLIAEHLRVSELGAALAIAKRELEEFPDEPLSWITLAEIYLSPISDAQKSVEAINRAVDVARATGTFRRQALQTKARILRHIGAFSELESCLNEIINEPASTGTDVAKEDDFLEGLSSDAISQEMKNAYRSYMSSP